MQSCIKAMVGSEVHRSIHRYDLAGSDFTRRLEFVFWIPTGYNLSVYMRTALENLCENHRDLSKSPVAPDAQSTATDTVSLRATTYNCVRQHRGYAAIRNRSTTWLSCLQEMRLTIESLSDRLFRLRATWKFKTQTTQEMGKQSIYVYWCGFFT